CIAANTSSRTPAEDGVLKSAMLAAARKINFLIVCPATASKRGVSNSVGHQIHHTSSAGGFAAHSNIAPPPHPTEESFIADLPALEHDLQAVPVCLIGPGAAQGCAWREAGHGREGLDIQRADNFAGAVAAGNDDALRSRPVEHPL